MEHFIADSISKKAVNRFYRTMKENNFEIHTFQIWRGGKKVVRIAQAPYSCTDVKEIYSLSKTFTSTLVGIASDMGLISDETRVLDIFPEIKTDNEYFNRLKVKHVLSMNTGHAGCVMNKMAYSDNALEGFFSVEPTYEPGTHFTYNTGASCLLGIMLERVTGKSFFDFACEKLFYPLGIHNIRWGRCHDGSCIAGAGLHISNDDIIKLGLTYLNRGVYEGKRIVSEEWIEKATRPISDNSCNGTPDWASGYGYQIWINAEDGYRGDGACGQLCIVIPKYDAVVAVQGAVGDMQKQVTAIFELMASLDPGGEDEEAEIFALEPKPVQEDVPEIDKIYLLEENPQGFRTMHLTLCRDRLSLSFTDSEAAVQTVSGGNGEWIYSEYRAKNMITTLCDLMPAEQERPIKTAGCFTVEDGNVTLHLRYMNDPLCEHFDITFDGDSVHVKMDGGIRYEKNKHIYGKEMA